jgi:diguanylate cyclase
VDATGDARTAVPRPVEDRLVRVCAVLVALALGWFAVWTVHPIGPPVLLWITTPLYGPIAGWICWLAADTPGMPAAARRFWRLFAVAAVLVGAGQTAQAQDILNHPGTGGAYTGPAMLAFDGVALIIIIYALLRLPTRRESDARLRILLDASTVMLATAVFIWHFGTRQMVAVVSPGAAAMSLGLTVVTLLGVFALARAMLTEHKVIDAEGVRLLTVAMFVGALAPLAQPLATALEPRLWISQVSIPLVFLLAARAGAVQRRRGRPSPRRGRSGRARPFSLMPYTAVAAVDGLLLWVVFVDHADLAVVASAAVTLTAVVVMRQVSALRDNGRLLAQLDHGATHDALTGLPNRVLYQRRLHEALTARGEGSVAVLLIDLDDFKEVNDTLGHEVGDLLLVEVAGRLAAHLRPQDTVARFGGDEFVMVLGDGDPATTDDVAEQLVAALRRPVVAGGHELAIRASIGIADGRAGDDPSLLLRRADIAMYAAKAVRGTAYLHYHEGMTASGSDHGDLVAELREAIETDQLFLLYQPIVSLEDGRLIGAEALVRWAHAARGVLTPDAFLPAAERSGLTVPLARWVLGTAFRQLAAWPVGAEAPPMLHVNLSAQDLQEPGLAAEVGDLLRMHAVDPRRITVEVTESAALDGAQALRTLHELRGLGLRISLDDFGTGYSTLSLLHECPVDEIKLDRSFTQAGVGDQVPMAAAVMHLAQVLGMHVIAEGVETRDQAEHLLDLGYVAAQGYYFARPVAPEAFAELLRRPTPTPLAG